MYTFSIALSFPNVSVKRKIHVKMLSFFDIFPQYGDNTYIDKLKLQNIFNIYIIVYHKDVHHNYFPTGSLGFAADAKTARRYITLIV